MKKKIVAIIPARGGSKGLPNKNIIEIAGKPLVAWSIEASQKSKYITKTIVSSEDDRILEISNRYGADVRIRPNELAQDDTPMVPVIVDAIESLAESYDYIVLLQPTSPFRDNIDIDDALNKIYENELEADALISVYIPKHSPLKSLKQDNNGYLCGILNGEESFMRRQDLPVIYMSNGAIYIIKSKVFLEKRSFCPPRTIPFIMSHDKSVDIDTYDDFIQVQKIFEEKYEAY